VQRWRGIESAPSGWGRCVVTIGVFDGVHRGHQQIIGRAVEKARAAGLPSVVLTFDPHPSEVVRPGSHLHAAAVVVGENFRYGAKAAGDVTSLAASGRRFGFTVEGAPLQGAGETTWSSTYVRSCVAAGDVAAAAQVLGREHRVDGVVVRGDQRGREIGYPTANLEPIAWSAVPADGVYAGRLVRGAQYLPAAISIGTNPTFEGRERRVEAYVLDFTGDLYGDHVGLTFTARLRETLRFDGVEPLLTQMALDVARTRELLPDPLG